MQLLREHDEFRRLWLAQTISQIGSQISYLAVPLTAAVTLEATPFEMGVLTAIGAVPALIVGVFAGAVVDRRARRPVLISADLARAALLGLIPAAWVLGALNLPLLYGVAFLVGLCSLFFDIAYQAFLPTVIERRRLVEGNSGLELSRSAAEVAGPSLAGGLIQLVKAPLALALDALSFVASAVLIARIRTRESLRRDRGERSTFWTDVVVGLHQVGRNPTMRSLAITVMGFGIFNAMIEAVVILYLTRTIAMEPGVLGLVFAAGSGGFVIGALLPGRIVSRFGIGPTMAVAMATIGVSDLALPLVGHDLLLVSVAVALGQFFFGLGMTTFNVTRLTIVQTVVPEGVMGRVAGSLQVLGWGLAPLGAVVGGVLGASLGLRSTLVIAAVLETAVAVWIWWSPLWTIRQPSAID